MSQIRGRDLISEHSARAAALWDGIEAATKVVAGCKPFEETPYGRAVQHQYLQSQARTSRSLIADGHSRYEAPATAPPGAGVPVLGPVETDIVSFAYSSIPTLVVLVGGMGCGKSTTLNYVRERFLQDHAVIYCNL